MGCQDGEIELQRTQKACLQEAVEVILGPFERESPIVIDAHFYGALYTQALVPWLSAWRSGAATRTLAALVQRVGKAIVHCYERVPKTREKSNEFRKRIPERMQLEYLEVSHVAIWGARDKDPVWKAFFS